MDLTELVKATEQWFIDRNLHNSDPSKQMLKLFEEYGELCDGYLSNDRDIVTDSIGDMLVVLIGLSLQKNVNLDINNHNFGFKHNEKTLFIALSSDIGDLSSAIAKGKNDSEVERCLGRAEYTIKKLSEALDIDRLVALSMAYDEIKDRKGKLIDGVFVKEEDLK